MLRPTATICGAAEHTPCAVHAGSRCHPGGSGSRSVAPVADVRQRRCRSGPVRAETTQVGPCHGARRHSSGERPHVAFSRVVAQSQQLLAGRQAFEGETASEILASVIKSDPDLAALPPRLNPRLTELLRRCLEKDRKKRWHAAADVRVEIELVMGRAIVADEPGFGAGAARPLWKRAVPVAAALAVCGLIAGYSAWALKPEPARTVMRFSVPLGEGQRFTSVGRQVIALSLDGSNLVYVANQRLYLRSMSALDAHVIVGSDTGSPILNPTFSPDGQAIVFYSTADSALKRLAIGGGAPITICPAQAPFGIGWDEHGIVFGQAGKGILRVSPNGGTPQVIAGVSNDQIASSPQMLPGGKAVLFSLKNLAATWDQGQVVVQTLDNGARKTLVDGGADGR